MVHIDGASSRGDILSVAVATTTAPMAPTAVQIFSPSSAVIVPPAASSTTSSTTSAAETDCVDAPDWTDAYGQGCAYYANDDGGYDRCAAWGHSGAMGPPHGGAAVDDCCVCGGGRREGDPSSSGSGVTATTTTTADEEEGGDIDDAALAAAGTCGNGERGDGICANGKCCSEVR